MSRLDAFHRLLGMIPDDARRVPCFACEVRGVAPDDEHGSVRYEPRSGAWCCPWCGAAGNAATYVALGELTRQLELAREPWLATDQGGVRLQALQTTTEKLLREGARLETLRQWSVLFNEFRGWPDGGPIDRESLARVLVSASQTVRWRGAA